MKLKDGVDYIERKLTKLMSRALELVAMNEAHVAIDSEVRQFYDLSHQGWSNEF